MQSTKPNIIFILADDLGWGDLACYGNLVCKTPRLDRMAGEGVLFEQYYVNAPLCSPSRAALLTGQFPARHGIHYWMAPGHNALYGMPSHLDPEAVVLPRLLQQGGYRTAHFGKWHVGEDPAAPVKAYGYDEVDIIWQGAGPNPGVRPNDPHGTEKLVDRTIEFARGCATEGKPFFVNLWLRDVHAALDPSEESLARYEHLMSERRHTTAMQVYYASVTEMDHQIGRLLDWIDAQPGLSDQTLIIFTSDNGPEDIYIAHAGYHAVGLPGPFRGRKRSLYEGGTRMPFIARWRGRLPAGRLDKASVISGVDLLPTFAVLAGVALPKACAPDGEDFSHALIAGETHERRKPLFWEWRFDGVGQCLNRSPMLSIREGDWKLLMNPARDRLELYDIPRQPMELHSQAEKHPEIVERLVRTLLDWQKTLPPGPISDRPGSDEYPGHPETSHRGPSMDPREFERLMKPVRVTLTREDYEND